MRPKFNGSLNSIKVCKQVERIELPVASAGCFNCLSDTHRSVTLYLEQKAASERHCARDPAALSAPMGHCKYTLTIVVCQVLDG